MQSAIEYIKALQDLVAQKREHEKEENITDRVTSSCIDVSDGSNTAILTSHPDYLCEFLNSSASFPANGFLDSLVGANPVDDVISSPLSLNVSSAIDINSMTSSIATDDVIFLQNDLENIDPSLTFSMSAKDSVAPCNGPLPQGLQNPRAPLSSHDKCNDPVSYYEFMS